MCFLFLFWHCIIGPYTPVKKSFIIPMAIEIPAFQTANIPYSFSFKTRYSNLFSAFTPEAVDVS